MNGEKDDGVEYSWSPSQSNGDRSIFDVCTFNQSKAIEKVNANVERIEKLLDTGDNVWRDDGDAAGDGWTQDDWNAYDAGSGGTVPADE